jgi:type VI secretion system FHA domain protein
MATTLFVRISDPEQPEHNCARRFAQPIVTIGRGANNDLPLPACGFVSTRHAELHYRDGQAFLLDPGSLNGTRFGGQTVVRGEPLALPNPARFEIGRLVFEVHLEIAAGAHRTPFPSDYQAARASQESAAATHPQAGQSVVQARPQSATGRLPQGNFEARTPTDSPQPVPPPADRQAERQAPRTAFVDLGRVHALVRSLGPSYQAYRKSQEVWQESLAQGLANLPENEQHIAQALLERHFGVIGEIKRAAAVDLDNEEDVSAAQQLAAMLLPPEMHPRDANARTRLIIQTGQVALLSVDALVKLVRGLELFLQELGVRLHRPITPLHAAATTAQALAYVLDPRSDDPQRRRALEQVWTEAEIHPIALINAVRAGAQALLGRLDPGEIERATDASWSRAQALWKTFSERYGALAEDEQQLARVLFGQEFCRAYTAYTEDISAEHEK